ncbi:MAG: prepilin peptidase [Rhodospirillales bacterium]|nr:prepilin peptidase [Rhodospirillales bacterium]
MSDFRSLLIPNWTSLTILLIFIPGGLLAGMELAAIGMHLGVGAVLFVLGAFLFSRGIMGGGDTKMLAAIGVWAGPSGIGGYLILVALLGGLLALAVLILRRLPVPRWLGERLAVLPWLGGAPGAAQPLPYGVAIGLAAFLLFFFYADFPISWDRLIGRSPLSGPG